ncbi:MAG TPA: hypothetical protein VMQ86_13875 [Bryobacteraceae bacterium]|nr:hypothetical protein [Bryobacteraceae bacterium]
MKQTDLGIFYSLGEALGETEKLDAGVSIVGIGYILQNSHDWLLRFLIETEGVNLPDTRAAAQTLNDLLYAIIHKPKDDTSAVLSTQEMSRLVEGIDRFEDCFRREQRYLDVFTVTKKGIYDTRLLMTVPEEKFSERIRSLLPKQTVSDLRQAARCLAFDIPTACAFHICRATESLILKYYEALSGHGWTFKKRDWKIYVEQLVKENAPRHITDRLDEIRELDRNAYTHPDRDVTVEEAPIQFELCTSVMFQMADEISRKMP